MLQDLNQCKIYRVSENSSCALEVICGLTNVTYVFVKQVSALVGLLVLGHVTGRLASFVSNM